MEKPYPLTIRDTFVPQTAQVPRVAGLPFLSVTCAGLRISRLALHFRQYASIDTSGDLVWGQFTTLPDEVTVGPERETVWVGNTYLDAAVAHARKGCYFPNGHICQIPLSLNFTLRLVPGHEHSFLVYPGLIDVNEGGEAQCAEWRTCPLSKDGVLRRYRCCGAAAPDDPPEKSPAPHKAW